MTEQTDDPPSPTGDIPAHHSKQNLHVVKGSNTARDETNTPDRHRDASLMGFLKGLISGKSESSLHDALKEYVADGDTGNGPQSLAPDERTLISNILKLRDTRAVDVMIPRADITAIDITTSPDQLLALLSEKQYSRFPVYRDSLDDIVGTIHIKDILATLARKAPLDIEQLVRGVPIISPAMHVLDLLLEMKETRRQMALVVDEFGGIDGLITVGDIIGSIVGDIEDEHEIDDTPQLVQLPDGIILADGRVDVEMFEMRFGDFLSDEERQDVDTLGGLVFAIAGRVPSRGEVVSHDSGMVFEVLDADPRRVHRLRIKPVSKDTTDE